MDRMTTGTDSARPRPRVEGVGSDGLARMAYGSVEGLPFLEPNDGNRLGYHIYLYLNGELSSIADAIGGAKSRTSLHPRELERIIAERLGAAGVPVE
jgi:hypothetical protein